jgi:hypothetical protein
MPRLALFGLVPAVLLHALPAPALDVADCRLWLEVLGGETATVPLARDEHDALLRQLRNTPLEGHRPNLPESIDSVTKFQDRAAALGRDGKVSPTEGERLHTLSETVRRCLERVDEED